MKERVILVIVIMAVFGCSRASGETSMVDKNGPPQPEQAALVAASTVLGITISGSAEEGGPVATTSAAGQVSPIAAPVDGTIQCLAPICIQSECHARCRTISFKPNTCYAGGHCVGGGPFGVGATCKCWKHEGGTGIPCSG